MHKHAKKLRKLDERAEKIMKEDLARRERKAQQKGLAMKPGPDRPRTG